MPEDRSRRLLAAERAGYPAALRRRAAAMDLDSFQFLLRLQVYLRESGDDTQSALVTLDLAALGEMPGAPHAVGAFAAQQVGDFDELPRRLHADRAPVNQRVGEPFVTLVLADEQLAGRRHVEFDAAGVGMVGPHEVAGL